MYTFLRESLVISFETDARIETVWRVFEKFVHCLYIAEYFAEFLESDARLIYIYIYICTYTTVQHTSALYLLLKEGAEFLETDARLEAAWSLGDLCVTHAACREWLIAEGAGRNSRKSVRYPILLCTKTKELTFENVCELPKK